jgi:6-phosphofructokinase 1
MKLKKTGVAYMENAVKRIGVLTSGGDAPGMNAAVRSVVRSAIFRGIECIGIRRGFNGLITGDIVRLDADSVGHIINRGGTILYTARSDEFRTLEGQKKAAATCKLLGLDGIVAIGGDGTFRGLLELSKQGISVVGIPATIDNDIVCTDYTIGYDTAANTAVEAIDRLRDTMQSHERCSVVEVMGRNAGHLALYVGLAVGATAVLVPEKGYDFDRDVVEKIRQARLNGKTHYMIVVAEGAGSALEIGDRIHNELGLDPRVTILGHIQRGGTPSARDRVMATRMGYHAVAVLAEGKTNRVICAQAGNMVDIDIIKGLSMKKGLNEQQYEVLEAMTGIGG